jgi:hypothetical protein
MSAMEPQTLQYLQFHTERLQIDQKVRCGAVQYVLLVTCFGVTGCSLSVH